MHKSVATISSPEFINLQPLDINPLMSKCEIKVCYVGESRNHTYMDKETTAEMAKTLRGAPIVGYFKPTEGDFADHGEQVIIDDEGIKFNCLTKPYGFVAPDAKVWFQKFDDYDEFGNSIEREYLMTTGFLWTGQFPECSLAVEDEGRPHSMELDEKTLNGYWAENYKNGMDFFIINDAIFSKLCILGENVEPCFEGSSVTAPNVSSNFSLCDDNFKNTLFTMMQDLQSALQGGYKMDMENTVIEEVVNQDENVQDFTAENENDTEENTSEFVASHQEDENNAEFTAEAQAEEVEASEEVVETEEQPAEEPVEAVEEPVAEADAATEFTESEEQTQEEIVEEVQEEVPTTDFVQEEVVEDAAEEVVETIELSTYTQLQADFEALENRYNTLSSNYDDLQTRYSSLEERVQGFDELNTRYQALEAENVSLKNYKLQIEKDEKEKLINSFYMLPAEDREALMENHSKFSKQELERELKVLCFDRGLNFESAKKDKLTTVNFSMAEVEASNPNQPDWVRETLEIQKNN